MTDEPDVLERLQRWTRLKAAMASHGEQVLQDDLFAAFTEIKVLRVQQDKQTRRALQFMNRIGELASHVHALEAVVREAVAYADVAGKAEGMPDDRLATRLTVAAIADGQPTIHAVFDVMAARALLAKGKAADDHSNRSQPMTHQALIEPEIIINGVTLTTAQAMAVRVAVSAFNIDCGGDERGRAMNKAYAKNLREVFRIMLASSSETGG